MKNLSKELILITASELVEATHSDKISLIDVGKALGVSHAALYKYFPNKKALWTALALRWLDKQLEALFPFDTSGYAEVSAIAHDWLWTLASGKYRAKFDDPKMFAIYTTYIDHDKSAYSQHIQKLGHSFMDATGLDETLTTGILLSFMFFSAPAYADRWDNQFQTEFETVWTIVKNVF
ncbi:MULTISPECIES: TetR/AcrR family transcriptional regulator [Enterococcus]|uniref:TetR/AcrR family transcriptional regulator n=1 Tax=Enterococcus TaxID=1350 RepID=UPI00065DC64C|nr:MULTISPECIES: TetR/AcrR family transcriptional regulator [Enterococcus]KAF1301748.1 hypothetical protein BAU16_07610 [Enterococcus sp. JM9B]